MSNHIQQMDGISFYLKKPFDLSFLRQYGRVFKVFDDQDSGNLCFGVEGAYGKLFIKLAGAPTVRSCVSSETATRTLRSTVPIYRDLTHPNLIELLDTFELPGIFAMIFRWTDAVCMGRQYPESHAQFMALPICDKLRVFADVCSFLAHTAHSGYTAIDFYDGSILYDSALKKTMVCDIDFFRKQPCTNDMGRMWGSARFMSPEEYELGAALDEITNVYTLGAVAFSLFTDSDQSRAAWPLDDHRYAVARKAVSQSRAARHASILEFIQDWDA